MGDAVSRAPFRVVHIVCTARGQHKRRGLAVMLYDPLTRAVNQDVAQGGGRSVTEYVEGRRLRYRFTCPVCRLDVPLRRHRLERMVRAAGEVGETSIDLSSPAATMP